MFKDAGIPLSVCSITIQNECTAQKITLTLSMIYETNDGW